MSLPIPAAFNATLDEIKLSALLTDLLEPPSMKEGIAAGTRGPTKGEMGLGERLEQVVVHEKLHESVKEMFAKWASEQTVKADTASQRWRALVDPKTSAYLLSPEVHSESDTSNWVWTALLRPALLVLDSYLVTRPGKQTGGGISVHSASGPKALPRPDGLMSYGEGSVFSFEYKTHNALPERCFEALEAWSEAFRERTGRTRSRRAFRFWWPESDAGLDRETKLLTQIWAQMQTRDIHFAILSSYNTTRFFYRPKSQKLGSPSTQNTLFMSQAYPSTDDDLLLLIIAWLYRAFDSCHLPLENYKTIDNGWWPEDVKKGKPTRKNAEGQEVAVYGIDSRLYCEIL